jgi:hypothetical protein
VPSEEKKMKRMLMTTTRQGVVTGRKGGERCNCPGRQSPKGDKMDSKTNILSANKNFCA